MHALITACMCIACESESAGCGAQATHLFIAAAREAGVEPIEAYDALVSHSVHYKATACRASIEVDVL